MIDETAIDGGQRQSVLLVGCKAADLEAAFARYALKPGEVVCHTLDIYHRHAVEKVFHGEVKAVCSAHLPRTAPDGGEWEKVVFRTGPKVMSGELALDLAQEAVKLCGAQGTQRFVLDYVGRERDRNDLLDKLKDRTDRVFRAEWPASVPGGRKLMFTSYPGCFCHRRLDEGGVALAEVVCRELGGAQGDRPLPPSRILDMGCGCGLVGLLIADSLRQQSKAIDLVMVDSHTRAVEAAEENAAKFGIPAEVILSDNGSPARLDGTFDVFVGNPPYYSDYRIAEVFLETAKRALKKGGVCYTVCKNAAGLKPVQEKYFSSVEIIKRRGYAVLKSLV